MLEAYRKHVEERAAEGVPPKPLNEQQVAELVELHEQLDRIAHDMGSAEGEALDNFVETTLTPAQANWVRASSLSGGIGQSLMVPGPVVIRCQPMPLILKPRQTVPLPMQLS